MFPDLEFIKTALNAIAAKFQRVQSDVDAVKKSVDDIKPDVDAMRTNRPNWAQNDPEALDYVKNRPFYIIDEAYIGTLSFTATSSNTMDYTYTNVDKEIFSYFRTLSEAGEVIKVNIGGLSGLMSSTFDRGYFSFLGILSGRMKYDTDQIWTATINDENITLVDGDTYNVVFYDTTTPGHIPIDAEFLPSSVYTDSNAPVKRGSGEYSAIEGHNTTASGTYSHAEGYNTTASGWSAHAEGDNTTASGTYSHAEGYNTTASGMYSHAEGRGTTASDQYSHAEGYGTKASKMFSHAEGSDTKASGDYSHAEGDGTIASGVGSHAEGRATAATRSETQVSILPINTPGDYTHAEGYGTVSCGTCSHAEGNGTKASGNYSHSEGEDTTASGRHSHAEGRGTTASRGSQHVQGEYNVLDTDNSVSGRGKYAHIVGNGTSKSARSNAHTLDWDGNAWYAGTIEGTALIIKSSTEGSTKRFKITVDDTGTLMATEVI